MAVDTVEHPSGLRVVDGLVDTALERLIAAQLIERPDLLHEYSHPDFGLDCLADFHALAVVKAIANLLERKEKVNAGTVAVELETDGMQSVEVWYPTLVGRCPDVIRPDLYRAQTASLVRLTAKRRGAIAEVDNVENEIDEFALRDAEPAGKPQPRSLLVADVARLETPPIRSYSTGNLQLDTLLGGGINTRELCVVMGPPAAGKTAWAMSTVLRVQAILPVLYASTELEQHELMARGAAHLMGKPWAAIRRGLVAKADVIAALEGIQIRLIGSDTLPRDGEAALAYVEEEAKRMTAAYGVPPLVVVDYLQDLARGSERDLRSRVGDHASSLRAMSQRLDCGMVGVSSVSRTFYSAKKAAEFREYDDPTVYLAAAKESGDVDYAAARVLFLDAEDDREKPERDVRIAVAKSRDCRTGFAGARMVGESGRWYAAPEVVDVMSQSTKSEGARHDDDDQIMLGRLHKEIADGKFCTTNEVRKGNGISGERAEAALTRLRFARRAHQEERQRMEGGKPKTRTVWVLDEVRS